MQQARPRAGQSPDAKSGQHDVAAIARVLGVSRASVYRALANWGESVPR
jgi:DNA-binding phage protein